MKLPLYPIKFSPILKEKVWGGNKLNSLLGKKAHFNSVGESWEISGVENNISMVQNGDLKGKSILSLIENFTSRFLGKKVYGNYGNQFPLLFKFIDAKETLSVQLHPNDVLARERHNSFGKTEMWYIVQADENSELILGLKNRIDKHTFLNHLNKGTLTQVLHKEKVKTGDAFYIAPGFVHTIGKGVLLAEIQQTSDITYRVYDWNRPDIDGKMRELHIDLAMDAISFNTSDDFRLNTGNEQLIENNYFAVNQIDTNSIESRNLNPIDSFVVYMCVSGQTEISCGGVTANMKMGETVLIPAVAERVHFEKGSAKLLEIFVP